MKGPLYALALGSLVLIGIGAGAGLPLEASLACLAVGAAGFCVVLYRTRGGDR